MINRQQVIIGGAEVLVDAEAASTVRADIRIESGRIVALSEPGALPPAGFGRDDTTTRIDAAGCLAIPGLVDAHCHSYTSLLRGTVAGAPLDLFVIDAMARRAERPARSVYLSAQLHALELLKRGVTAHLDHFRHGALPSLASVEAAFAAYRDIGIRTTIAPMYEDRNYLDSMPIDAERLPAPVLKRWRAMSKPVPEACFDLMDALLPWRGRDDGLCQVMLGVDGPQRCSSRLLEMTADYAARHAMGWQTHLLEAKTQAMMAPVAQGFVAWLDRFGLVTPRTSFAHFVWCDDADIALVAERGASVVHNPVSNLHLGSGIQPIRRLLDGGINLALGTDSESGAAACLLEQAKVMALLSRVQGEPAARWVDARAAFRAATLGGARVLAQGDELGRIAPGCRADIVLIDTTGLDWQPRGELFSHLVMYETGANVRDVIVGGDVVIRNGRATRIDERALIAEAVAVAAADRTANTHWLEIAAGERDAFARLIEGALAQPLGIERHARLR